MSGGRRWWAVGLLVAVASACAEDGDERWVERLPAAAPRARVEASETWIDLARELRGDRRVAPIDLAPPAPKEGDEEQMRRSREGASRVLSDVRRSVIVRAGTAVRLELDAPLEAEARLRTGLGVVEPSGSVELVVRAGERELHRVSLEYEGEWLGARRADPAGHRTGLDRGGVRGRGAPADRSRPRGARARPRAEPGPRRRPGLDRHAARRSPRLLRLSPRHLADDRCPRRARRRVRALREPGALDASVLRLAALVALPDRTPCRHRAQGRGVGERRPRRGLLARRVGSRRGRSDPGRRALRRRLLHGGDLLQPVPLAALGPGRGLRRVRLDGLRGRRGRRAGAGVAEAQCGAAALPVSPAHRSALALCAAGALRRALCGALGRRARRLSVVAPGAAQEGAGRGASPLALRPLRRGDRLHRCAARAAVRRARPRALAGRRALRPRGRAVGSRRARARPLAARRALARAVRALVSAGPRAGRVATHVRTIDVAPTVLGLLGLAPLDGGRGSDLRALFEQRPEDRPELVSFAESILWGRPLAPYDEARTLVAGDRKVIVGDGGDGTALYDVAGDPGETLDLAASRPGETEEARRALEVFHAALRAAAREGRELELGESAADRLDHLGYVDDE